LATAPDLKERDDLMVSGLQVRDEKGVIVGCKSKRGI